MFEIGRSKRAQQAFAFDDITIVPSRRTRGDEEVSLQWRIDAYTFEFPLIAAPMDSVMSPATAIQIGQLGGLGVLNLEGLWTRYEDPEPMLDEIIAVDDPVAATRRMQEIYAEPIKPELIGQRIAEIRGAGVPAAGALSPQNTQAYAAGRRRLRRRLLRHPGDDGVGRARLLRPRRRSTSSSSSTTSTCR